MPVSIETVVGCDESSFVLISRTLLFLQLAKDLLHPTATEERRKHKLKRLVQHPNSFFMDVKCPGCYKITTVFSHAQSVVICTGCSTILCQPTGGRARLTEGKLNIFNQRLFILLLNGHFFEINRSVIVGNYYFIAASVYV